MRVSTYAGLFLLTLAALMHEILLTRICALRIFFHFTFVVISNCLLGMGAIGRRRGGC